MWFIVYLLIYGDLYVFYWLNPAPYKSYIKIDHKQLQLTIFDYIQMIPKFLTTSQIIAVSLWKLWPSLFRIQNGWAGTFSSNPEWINHDNVEFSV